MKNIYNLLTDAFDNAHLSESDYTIVVEPYYKVTISSKITPSPRRLFLFMSMYNNELYDVLYLNTLLAENELTLFIRTLDLQTVILTPPISSQEANEEPDFIEPID